MGSKTIVALVTVLALGLGGGVVAALSVDSSIDDVDVADLDAEVERPPTSVGTATTHDPEAPPPPPIDRPLLESPLVERPNSQENEQWLIAEFVDVELDVISEWAEASGLDLVVFHSDRPDISTPSIRLIADADRLVVWVTAGRVTQAVLG
ncbi:MAG: hypothetical protein GY926_01750 [bacterium]|nr:hypothetical protein [bacterium]MCP4963938.1 hypothetical protein [bacterium]